MSKRGTHFFNHTCCFSYFGESLQNLLHSTKLLDPSPLLPCSQQKGASLPGRRGRGTLPQAFLLGRVRTPHWEDLRLPPWHSQEIRYLKLGHGKSLFYALICQLAFAKHALPPSLGLRGLHSYRPAVSAVSTAGLACLYCVCFYSICSSKHLTSRSMNPSLQVFILW